MRLPLSWEVILVDYAGVGSSAGEPSSTIAGTARQMIAFVGALGLERIDLLEFSIGGFLPKRLRSCGRRSSGVSSWRQRGLKGAPEMHAWRDDIAAAARGESTPANLLYIMFAHAERMEFLDRFLERRQGRDTPTSVTARAAAIRPNRRVWGTRDHGALQRLTGIRHPTVVLHGDNDLMIPTKLSHLLTGLILQAHIRTYPDAVHGFLFQYPTEVAAEVDESLAADDNRSGHTAPAAPGGEADG
jgi:pimeloyl-ACP methyl ester carboxylesterase